MNNKGIISILVPVYNEEKNITYFFNRIIPVIEKFYYKYTFNFVFTDNDSSDQTIEEIKKYIDKELNITVIKLSKNFGRSASQYAGLENSKADLHFMIDIDCEDPPELLENFISKIESGYDIVYGIRNRIKESIFLFFFAKLYYRICKLLSDNEIILDMAEFSIFKEKVRKEVLKIHTNFPYIRGEISSVGFKKIGIKYKRIPRKLGTSKFKFFDLIYFAIGGVLSTSTFFLRLASILGIIILITNFSFVILHILSIEKFNDYLNLIFLLNISLIINFLIFISIYLARIHKNILMKPIYIIDYERSINLVNKN